MSSDAASLLAEVAALCDSIVVIAKVEVVATGSPDELRESTGQSIPGNAVFVLVGS